MIVCRIAACLVLGCGCLLVRAAEPLPQPLRVEVTFVNHGPETLREELERELLYTLERARCFASIEAYAGPAPEGSEILLLRVAIGELVDETDFDLSMAQRDSPNATPDVQRQLTSWLEFDYRLELHLLPEDLPLRSKSSTLRLGYRPQLDEDPREENRIQAIEQLVLTTKSFACKTGPNKLRKAIERARAAAR